MSGGRVMGVGVHEVAGSWGWDCMRGGRVMGVGLHEIGLVLAMLQGIARLPSYCFLLLPFSLSSSLPLPFSSLPP